jgi:hypothetical protein
VLKEELYPDIPKKSAELVSRLASNNPRHVDFSIEYVRTLFKDELDRSTEVERKAALLVGAGGVAAVIFTALGGFLLDFPTMLPGWPRYILVGLVIALAITFSLTIFFSLKVLWVGQTSYPGALPLFEGQNLDTIQYKKLHIADLFIAYSNNVPETNRKVNNLALGQKCFLVSLAILLVTGGFMAVISLLLD